MSGLTLGMGSYGGASLPTAANNPSSTISQQAFGITSGSGGPSTAAAGAVGSGAIAAALLAWLWWTLPR